MSDQAILFTGFPGFIGARLVPRLLELLPGASVHCLVQDKFLAAASASIAELEAKHPHTKGRILTATGDITLPDLGLDPAAARDLKPRVNRAYHLAAVYDLAVPRDVGVRINLEGTRRVLDFLAGCEHLERHDYVSTAYVSGTFQGGFKETDLDVGQGFKNFYEETKFLAEVEVVRSKLPTTVYRPGIVVGDSRTGETAKFDGPYFVATAMERVPPGFFIRIGTGRNPANLVPVDFVIEAIARLSASPASLGKTYHLTDPHGVSTFEVARLLSRELGRSFVFVPLPLGMAQALLGPAWVQRWLGMPAESLPYFDNPCVYDARNATADLAALGIACPRFPDYVPALMQYYRAKKGSTRRSAMI